MKFPMRYKSNNKAVPRTKSATPNRNDQAGEVAAHLSSNERVLKQVCSNSSDILFRTVTLPGQTRLLLVYVDGLVNTNMLDQVVLQPMMFEGLPGDAENGGSGSLSDLLTKRLVAVAQVKPVQQIGVIVESILKGDLAMLIDGENQALLVGLQGFEKRAIEEPSAELSVRGPRDGFTEALRTNTSLIRRRIRSEKLKMESLTLGQYSKTDIVIAYLEGVASESVLKEVRQRLHRIEIDGVLESGYIEEFIEDVPLSPFPQIQNTERPDIVCSSLLEGKIAIFVDNTPFVLIAPMTFWSGLQAVEDYYERSIYTSFIRLIRFGLLNISLLLPSLFVSLTTFHQQLVPTSLLISVAAAREGVPLPTVIETLLMEFMFEGLREAGIRLPKPIGSAVSIVGALVIGQAAVQAGIVSASVVIIVATTGIASFAIPRYNLGTAVRLLRFPMLILAGVLGLYGVIAGLFLIVIHLLGLRSFGIPYMTPISPQFPENMKDVWIRAPRWSMHQRPLLSTGGNKQRVPKGQRPSPKRGRTEP
ncbi:spore germination protein [Paenibacillus sp. J53TS2]|uniref:spore germination protein n=1 Tax=Paenibacillus sp. J53TS2 TaxID=2807197 RepID=UPI001B077255|nr:spore germination protein [Paenibacillus sp. J53TS2]GIP47761.1 spore germination protein [Paenibacillus sp. J53TS2]